MMKQEQRKRMRYVSIEAGVKNYLGRLERLEQCVLVLAPLIRL